MTLRAFRGIRARLAILIVIAVTALIGLLVYQDVQKHSRDARQNDESLQRLARFAAHAERERFETAERLLAIASQSGTSLRTAALNPASAEAYDACTRSLFVLDQLLPETTGFALWDTNGNSLCSSKGATRGEYSVADRLWFKSATQHDGVSVGAYELAPPDSQPSLGFGIPLKDATGKNVIGYLSSGLRLDKTDDLLAGANLPETGRIGVIDQNGIILGSTTGRTGEPAAPAYTEKFNSFPNTYDARFADIGARRIVAVRVTDPDDALVTIAVAADKDALAPPLAESLAKDLAPVGVIALLTLLAVWLLGQRWVLSPVRSLVSASEALRRGDLHARARVHSGVSEFEHLARSFNEMAATRERASHAKDEFLGLVSHELKTPITAAAGNADILRRRGDTLDPDQRRSAVEDIYNSTLRLNAIIDNMLALARLDRGAELESEPLLLMELVRAAIDDQERRAPGRHVVVNGDRSLLVLGGETYVLQVLANLVANAFKYSPRDTTVEVFVERGPGVATVRVCDRGDGVDPEERDAIFEPFYRSPHTARDAAGVGIGLSVCKRLIEAMGGTIWCSPRTGGGCEFGFTLPAVEPVPEGQQLHVQARSSASQPSMQDRPAPANPG